MSNEDKPTERAPMMSDETLMDIVIDKYGGTDSYTQDRCFAVAEAVRDFYESNITSGELRVVKKTRMVDNAGPKCLTCGYAQDYTYVGMNFCPGCGAQIVKE